MVGVERDVVAQPLADSDLDAEFLGEFAGQRVGLALPRGDLAARQLPATGQFGRPLALGDQHPAPAMIAPATTIWLASRLTVYGRNMAVLTDEQVDAALPDLNGWQREDGALRRSIKFPAFLAGIDAVRRVGEHAEAKTIIPTSISVGGQ